METHLKVIGAILIVLALVHAFFPKYFRWDEELRLLSLINRQLMEVHTFFIAFIILLMGVLCLLDTHDLVHSRLGRHICFFLGVFWFVRLLIQHLGYSSKLWKGKRFETTVHLLFSFLWCYMSAAFFLVALNQTIF